MLDAFKFGAPPHGGIAPGRDRIVMLLADEPNIRETIAFPLNQKLKTSCWVHRRKFQPSNWPNCTSNSTYPGRRGQALKQPVGPGGQLSPVPR